jgi:hypothetical protein
MIRHQAIRIKAKRIPQLRLREGLEESLVVLNTGKNSLAVIAPIQGMVNQTVSNRARQPRHFGEPSKQARQGQRKK